MTDINIILRNYEHYGPLVAKEAKVPGFEVNVDFNTALTLEFPENVHAAEISFNRYAMSVARGGSDLIGLPVFVLRGFSHRKYLVAQNSPLKKLSELRGKRIGSNSWSDTGTMWTRAALRDAGVGMNDVEWVIGEVDSKFKKKPPTPWDVAPPANSVSLPQGKYLLDALEAGEIDAVTTAFAPDDVFYRGGRFRRLVMDFPVVEKEYYQRTGVYPGFHVMAFRRSVAEQNPEAVLALFNAMKASWDVWLDRKKRFGGVTPWALADFETFMNDFAGDNVPFGTESEKRKKMLKQLCIEQFEQGLVPKLANPDDLFADFYEIMAKHG